MARTYLEDMVVGSSFGGEIYRVEREEMLEFARRWDPRPVHVDDAAGEAAGFGGAIASGAYTTAIFTLLSMRSREKDGEHAVIAGLGAELRLPLPVRAGDVLCYEATVLEIRGSAGRPDAGVVRTRGRLVREDGEVVYESTTATLVARRPA